MKKVIITGMGLLFFTLTIACGNNTNENKTSTKVNDTEVVVKQENTETEEKTEIQEEEVVTEEVNSKYNYDLDWDTFKKAVIDKDIPGISAFAGSDEIDAGFLLTLLSDEGVLKDLKNTTYDDLKTVEENGEILLEFHSEETAKDENGNETGSSVSVFFSQGDPSLVLEYYIAAG